MSDERLDSITVSNYKITPELSFFGTKTTAEFNRSCLNQDKISLTKNTDMDQCKYSGYGIGFDRQGEFSFGNGLGRNCIIFGADLSSSSHANNKKKCSCS